MPTGSFGVDRSDSSRAVRAAQDAGVAHAWHLDVVHVCRCASDEPRIFAAADALANQGLSLGYGGRHGRSLLRSGFRRGSLHGIHNVLISGAAAQIALDAMTALFLGGLWVTLQH